MAIALPEDVEQVRRDIAALVGTVHERCIGLKTDAPSDDVFHSLATLDLSRIERFNESTVDANGAQSVSAATVAEIALRRMLLESRNTADLRSARTDNRSIENHYRRCFAIFDTAILLQQKNLCDEQLPLSLIEEALDIHVFAHCEKLFSFLENRQELLCKNISGLRGKGLILLRLCNELLRRTSKLTNSLFCGRIQMYLASVFEPSERSGVNLRGDFHVDNITTFNVQPPRSRSADSAINIEDRAIQERETTISQAEQALDTLYEHFWSMQSFLANPQLLFEPAEIGRFRLLLAEVFSRFRQISKPEDTADNLLLQASEISTTHETIEQSPYEWTDPWFSSKFLTSRKLFPLQLNDPNFKCHVLIQINIVLQYLLSLSVENKPKISDLSNPNRSLILNFVLAESDEVWIKEAAASVQELLEYQVKGRESYIQTVKDVFDRDRFWVRWKENSCPQFEKKGVSAQQITQSMEPVRSFLSQHLAPIPYKLGNAVLSRLWQRSGELTLETIKTGSVPLPDFNELANEVDLAQVRVSDASNEEEKADLKDRCTSLHWKALRAAIKDSLSFFDKINNGNALLLRKAQRGELDDQEDQREEDSINQNRQESENEHSDVDSIEEGEAREAADYRKDVILQDEATSKQDVIKSSDQIQDQSGKPGPLGNGIHGGQSHEQEEEKPQGQEQRKEAELRQEQLHEQEQQGRQHRSERDNRQASERFEREDSNKSAWLEQVPEQRTGRKQIRGRGRGGRRRGADNSRSSSPATGSEVREEAASPSGRKRERSTSPQRLNKRRSSSRMAR